MLLVGGAYAQSDALKLEARAGSKKYSKTQMMVVKLKITNTLETPFALSKEFTWGYGGTMKVGVFERDGDPVPFQWAMHGNVYGRDEDGDKLVVLSSEQSIEFDRVFIVGDLIEKPGRYTIVFEYRAPKELPKSQYRTWTREDGPLEASIDIEVADRH